MQSSSSGSWARRGSVFDPPFWLCDFGQVATPLWASVPSFYMIVIIIPSLKGRGEDQMSWVRASTILSICDAQSIGGGRCSRKAGSSCSRKAGGRYTDHSVVCGADLPLNMSLTVCSCPARWTTGRLLFLQPSHGACCPAGGVQGGSSLPLAPWAGGLCSVHGKGYSPHARKHVESHRLFPHSIFNTQQLLTTPPWPPSPSSS